MDNFWIFLIIIGAIVSYAQKNQAKRQQSDDETAENPHEEFERRLRELIEGKQEGKQEGRQESNREGREVSAPTYPTVPKPTVTPSMEYPAPVGRRSARHQSTKGQSVAEPARTATHRSAVKGNVNAPKSNIYGDGAVASVLSNKGHKTPKTGKNITTKAAAEQSKKNSNIEIERIVKDFSMEKAVIYSEILKPKFEEY